MGGSLRLGSLLGVAVEVHVSWFLILALMSTSLALGWFPAEAPGISEGEAWVLGIAGALLLFGSVLVHELAHSVVARARGLEAKSITLFLFGGVSSIGGEARTAATEFLVAIVGPITSFALAAVAFAVSLLVDGGSGIGALVGYLALVNVLLGGFNLVPGFPLDGGRVLRAILWSRSGSMRRSTETAVQVGQVVAYLFVGWGILQIFSANLIGGLWIAAIGWFLNNAATAALQQLVVEQGLAGLSVGQVFRPDPTTVLPGETLAEVADRVLLPGNRRAVPVADGRLVGILTLTDIGRVPLDERASVRVAEAMGGRDGIVTVRPEDSLRDALEALGRGDFEQLPVVDAARRPLGLLTRADVIRAIPGREVLAPPDRVERDADQAPRDDPGERPG
jgi:Zn-dependent protease/CBS domain-containing protein